MYFHVFVNNVTLVAQFVSVRSFTPILQNTSLLAITSRFDEEISELVSGKSPE